MFALECERNNDSVNVCEMASQRSFGLGLPSIHRAVKMCHASDDKAACDGSHVESSLNV